MWIIEPGDRSDGPAGCQIATTVNLNDFGGDNIATGPDNTVYLTRDNGTAIVVITVYSADDSNSAA